MKTKMIALLAGAGALAVGAAYAGDKDKKDRDYDWEAKVEEGFTKVDADGNGLVTQGEYLAYKAAKAEESWAGYDLGDDGALSLEEAKAAHKAEMKRKKEKKEKKDKS